MSGTTCTNALPQALVGAGPWAEQGQANTLQSVVSKGSSVPVHGIYDKLHQWRFDMARLHSLGVLPRTRQCREACGRTMPRSSVSRTLSSTAGSMRTRWHNLKGAVAQSQMDELWRCIVAEARGVQATATATLGSACARADVQPMVAGAVLAMVVAIWGVYKIIGLFGRR